MVSVLHAYAQMGVLSKERYNINSSSFFLFSPRRRACLSPRSAHWRTQKQHQHCCVALLLGLLCTSYVLSIPTTYYLLDNNTATMYKTVLVLAAAIASASAFAPVPRYVVSWKCWGWRSSAGEEVAWVFGLLRPSLKSYCGLERPLFSLFGNKWAGLPGPIAVVVSS